MLEFLKAQASSLLATFFDFSTAFVLKYIFNVHHVLASVIGNISGGIVNFIVNRTWSFKAEDKEYKDGVEKQSAKYLLVWLGSLGLNALGVYIMVDLLQIDFRISKLVTSLIVGWGYNYVFQKYYVFKK